MSLAIEFANRQQVPRFLKWVTQPQIAYQWGDADRFYVRTETVAEGRTKRTEARVWAWFPDAEPDHIGLVQACDLTDCKRTAQLSEKARAGVAFTLEQFLRAAALTRVRPGAAEDAPDLLAAFYDVSPREVAESFAAVPKNPLQPSALELLEPTGDDAPRTLLKLPQADPSYPWNVWLEAENRRLAPDAPAAVKLFAHLPGGTTAEYYVEYGWAHPLPELRELYPNGPNARYILIAATDRRGSPKTNWTHLVTQAGDALFELEAGADAPVEFELGDRTEVTAVEARRATDERLLIRPRVETLARGEREDLEGLEKAIQGAKNSLVQLEQRRLHVLDRRQGRFRLLLRFRQEKSGPATPELSANAQQFLLLSRRQADLFQYVFQDETDGSGHHVLFTRDPVFSRDLHIGLADNVYYQPPEWQDWQFDVFVRDDCELLPRIDSADLAARLLDKLGGGAGAGGLDGRPNDARVLLVDPVGNPTGDLRITALAVPHGAELPRQLGFLNTDYPIASVRSRAAARDEMQKELARTEVDLVKEVRAIEQRIAAEALERLNQTQALWNTTAQAIDTARAGVDVVENHYRVWDQLTREFARSWVDLVTNTLKLNTHLVEPKLAALDHLDQAQPGWQADIAAAVRGHARVDLILAPLKAAIDAQLRDGLKTHGLVKARYETAETETRTAEAELTRLEKQVNDWHKKMAAGAVAIEKRFKQVNDRKEATEKLLGDLRQLTARLAAARTEFLRLEAEVRAENQRARDAIATADECHRKIGEARDACRKNAQLAETRRAEIEAECAAAEGEIKRLNEKAGADRRRAKQLGIDVLKAQKQLAKRKELAQADLDAVKAEVQVLTSAAAEVGKLEADILGAGADRTRASAALEAAAQRLNPVIAGLAQTHRAGLVALRADFEATARNLQALAEMEVAADPLKRLRRQAELRKQVQEFASEYDPLSPDAYAAAWETP